jgi:hypothetical protein
MNSKIKLVAFGMLLLSSSLVIAGRKKTGHKGSRPAQRNSSASSIAEVNLAALAEKLHGFKHKEYATALFAKLRGNETISLTTLESQARHVAKPFCMVPGKNQVSQALVGALVSKVLALVK